MARTAKHVRTPRTSQPESSPLPPPIAQPPASSPQAPTGSAGSMPAVDATAQMPAVPEETRVAAPLSALAKLRRSTVDPNGSTNPPGPPDTAQPARRPVDDDDFHPRRRIGLIAAGVAALLVVATITVVAVTGDDGTDGPGVDSGEGSAAELIGAADIGVPATAEDGLDSSGNTVTYEAANMADQKRKTAWRMPGDGSGQELEIDWGEPHTVTKVGLINGYTKRDSNRGDDWYTINRRVLEVTWIFSDGTEVSQSLEEVRRMQTIALDEPVTTDSIRLRIDAVSEPGGRDFTSVSEIAIRGW